MSSMLVQLSPWKTAKTSIKVPKSSRRRKRDESQSNNEFPVAVSFITTSTRKGLQKLRQHAPELSESFPLMALTSDHQITVVGQSKEPSYEEYSSLKYASRPGSAGSFFAPPNGKSGANQRIPAIFDAKNDRVYAFQHGNTRLCCWNSLLSSGPDEKGSLKVELSHPALSLALLPMHKGVVYGTCTDGSIFVARVVGDSKNGESISVEYIPTKQPTGSVHIGTLAELSHGQTTAALGRKRKASDIDTNSIVTFYQVFCIGESVKFFRREAACERFSRDGRLVIEESLSYQATSIDLGNPTDQENQKIDSVELLITSSGSTPKAALFYTYVDGMKYCALLSLASGDLSHYPILLPTATKQCGLVTGTLLAVGTKDELLLYDLETGCILHSIDARPILDDSTSDWILSTNSKFSTIAIIHLTDGAVIASFSVVSLEGSKLPSSSLSLASKLASSCLTSLQVDEKPNANSSGAMIINDLIMAEDVLDLERPSAELEESVKKTLETFDEARVKVMATDDGKGDCIFLETYESCISSLIDKMKVSDTLNGIAPDHNPQDALPSNGKLLNGKKKKTPSKSRTEKDLNGVNSHSMKPRGLTPTSLPQPFIDGALQIVLSFLQCGEIEGRRATFAQVNARLILNQLVKTGKVSARLHFENATSFQAASKEHILESTLRSIELSNKRGQRVYSPVDMILGMLRWCPDLSERQLVAMLNYMLRRSLPDDVAEALKESKLSIQHPYMKLCQRYFSLRDQYLKQSSRDKNAKIIKNRRITYKPRVPR